MKEISLNAKKTFCRIGMVYTIMSVAVTLFQLVIAFVGLQFIPRFTLDMQMMVSSASLYIIGMLVLYIGLHPLKNVTLQKHKMSAMDILKAFCMCYAVLIASNLLGQLLTTMIGILKGSPIINPVETLTTEISMPVLILLTVICAPIFEELFFRKILIDKTASFGELPAILLSGLMFGLFHGNLTQFPYAFAIGIFFGFIYIRTGNISYTMILHAMINCVGAVVSSLVMEGIDLDAIGKLINQAIGIEMLEPVSMESVFGLVKLIAFEAGIFVVVIAGVILWILHAKKLFLYTREQDMPRGERLKTVLGNWGMILYILVWFAMIVYSLF